MSINVTHMLSSSTALAADAEAQPNVQSNAQPEAQNTTEQDTSYKTKRIMIGSKMHPFRVTIKD